MDVLRVIFEVILTVEGLAAGLFVAVYLTRADWRRTPVYLVLHEQHEDDSEDPDR